MSNNQDNSTGDKLKNLSKDEALREYSNLFAAEAGNILKAYENIDRLLWLLEQAGYNRTEAITKMANDAHKAGLKGFSASTIYRMLPQEIKHDTGRPKSLSFDKLSEPIQMRTREGEVQIGKKKVRLPGQVVDVYEHEAEAEHKVVRITMSVKMLNLLGLNMIAWTKANTQEEMGVIEYDYDEKVLYVDFAEEWEKTTERMVVDA